MWRRALTERPYVLKSASVVPTVVQATETSSIKSLFPVGTWYPSRNEINSCTCPLMTTGTELDGLLVTWTFVAFCCELAERGNAKVSTWAKAANTNACLFQNMQNSFLVEVDRGGCTVTLPLSRRCRWHWRAMTLASARGSSPPSRANGNLHTGRDVLAETSGVQSIEGMYSAHFSTAGVLFRVFQSRASGHR